MKHAPVHPHRRRLARSIAVVVALGLTVTLAGCRDSSSTNSAETVEGGGGSSAISNESAPAGAFGDVSNVCQKGSAKGATDQGVTDTSIQAGTLTDYGFTQAPQFKDAAEVFTKWCNDAGGVNGRQLTSVIRDTKIFEYRQRILEACQADFMLVGGGGAFDDSGVKDRLSCLLPEFPAQVVSAENRGSDLQVISFGNFNPKISPYEGYFKWLATEKYKDTADTIGIITGDVGVTRKIAGASKEVVEFIGGTVIYNDVYPASGASDWTPYAQAIKTAGVKGLIFLGESKQLTKLLQSLTDISYKVDWVDANSNAYTEEFISLGSTALDTQTAFSDPAVYPIENAKDNKPTQQLIDIFAKYKPDAKVDAQVVQAWSAWTLYATAIRDCGSNVTRKCVYENATKGSNWTGGGLHVPTDLKDKTAVKVCFTVEQASSSAWTNVDPGATEGGVYRCEDAKLTLKGDYGKPTTLADVGKSMSDLK